MVERMRRSRDELETLAQRFSTTAGHPPRTAIYAFAALLADDKLGEAIGESFTAEAREIWVLTGITDASLIHVHASSACIGWGWEEPGSEEDVRGEEVEATLHLLTAIRSFKVARIHSTGGPQDHNEYHWDAAWTVTLRDGETISLPASELASNHRGRDRVEPLIAAIRRLT
jgi:hypothetical protein